MLIPVFLTVFGVVVMVDVGGVACGDIDGDDVDIGGIIEVVGADMSDEMRNKL